jgi:hypothetical protein
MDVGYWKYRGASLAWIPPTLLPGPWYFEQQTGFGWLRAALGGFRSSCGLTHIGNPETDSVSHYNFPARLNETHGVHDRMADDCWIEAVGRVTQAQAYGENDPGEERTYELEIGVLDRAGDIHQVRERVRAIAEGVAK